MEPNVPARTEQHMQAVASWDPTAIANLFLVRTTYPQDTPAAKMLLLSIIDGECEPGEEHVGEVLEIEHYICHPVEVRDTGDGEIIDAIRTIIPRRGKRPLSFVSGTLLKSLGRLMWQAGSTGPFDPPLVVTLRQRASKRGRVYSLVPVMPEA